MLYEAGDKEMEFRIAGTARLLLLAAATMFSATPAARAAEDISRLEAMPYAMKANANEISASSRATQVNDPSASGGMSIRMIAERNTCWDCQWHFGKTTFPQDVPFTIYGVFKVRKTGEKGDAIGFGIYDRSRISNVSQHYVAAKEVKNMTWQAWKIGTLTYHKKFWGYPYAGIKKGNGANVPEVWFDEFIAVPTVNAQTEPILKRHFEKLRERKRLMQEILEKLKRTPVLQPPRLVNRFAFGVYLAFEQFSGTAKLFGEPWQNRFERTCEDFVRCYMNSIPIVNSPWSLASGDFSKMDDLVRIAGEVGVDIMPGAGGLPAGADYKAAQAKGFTDMVRRYKDKPSLLCWYLWDEPGPAQFAPIVNARFICDKISPDKSATVITCGTWAVRKYAPLFPVVMPDNYPVRFRSRDPWRIGVHVRYCRQNGARRIWMMHHNQGCLKGHGSIAYPTVGEFKLMSYLAVAEGAAGLIPYHYMKKSLWQEERYAAKRFLEQKTFTNAFETHDTLWPVHKEIGRRMTTVGPLLVGAKFLGEKGLKVDARTITMAVWGKGKALVARMFERATGERMLVVVNNDPNAPTTGGVTVEGLAGGLYDLFELKPFKAPQGKLRLSLPPGECKIFLIGNEATFQKAKEAILANRCRMERAIARVEIAAARRAKASPEAAEKLLARADENVKARRYAEALAEILRAAESARAAVDADPQLGATRANLEKAKSILGKLDDKLEENEFFFKDEIRHRGRELLVKTGGKYFRLLNRYRSGEGRKIVAAAKALADEAATLEAKIFTAAADK